MSSHNITSMRRVNTRSTVSMLTLNCILITPAVRGNNADAGPHDCDARCNPVSINSQTEGPFVFPEIAGYSPIQIESMAPMRVRDALDIDGSGWLRLDIH